MNSCTNPTGLVVSLMLCVQQSLLFLCTKKSSHMVAVENINVEPTIFSILTAIEIEFSHNVWICSLAKINTATIQTGLVVSLMLSIQQVLSFLCTKTNSHMVAAENISAWPMISSYFLDTHWARIFMQCLDLFVGKN